MGHEEGKVADGAQKFQRELMDFTDARVCTQVQANINKPMCLLRVSLWA